MSDYFKIHKKSSPLDFEINPEVCSHIFNYCKNFLGGIWKTADFNDFTVKKLTGGSTNTVLLCTLSDNHNPINSKPTKIIFRIYSKFKNESVAAETLIFNILSQKNLGPKLFGVFDGGRIEEYLPSRYLGMLDIANPLISEEIAKKLANIHQLEIPINKKAGFMDFIDSRYKNLSNNLDIPQKFEIPEYYHKYNIPKFLTIVDLQNEVEFIRSKLPKLLKNIVFCHNDLLGGNILFLENPENSEDKRPNLMLIDFEFASYNPRGFDIGNHFAEYCFDYDTKEPPYVFPEKIPLKEHMLQFLKTYLEEQNPKISKDALEHEANLLLKETLPFMPISHLFWCGHTLNVKLTPKRISIMLERLGIYFMQKHFLEEL